jgi:hypothetical protein
MTQYSDYFGPEGLRVRGTVLVVPGRGETRSTYTRFGRRLAADAYRVRVIDAPDLDTEDLPTLAARITTAAEDTTAEDGVAGPLILVGADSGAAAVAALLGQEAGTRPDAVVLAGLPGRAPAVTAGTWDEELDVRTSCPAHRGLLTQDAEVRRGSLDDAIPEAVLAAAYDSAAYDNAATPPPSRTTRRSRTPPSPLPGPGFRSCTVLTTTSSTTSSTGRWPPRSSPSWRPCATSCGR